MEINKQKQNIGLLNLGNYLLFLLAEMSSVTVCNILQTSILGLKAVPKDFSID